MIAAAIVCAAVFAQAAQYNWTGAYTYQCWSSEESENMAGGMAYLFVDGVNGVSGFDALNTAIAEGKFVSDNWAGKAVDSVGLTQDGGFIGQYNSDVDHVGKEMFAVVLSDRYWDEDGNLVMLDTTKELYATTANEAVVAGAQPELGGAPIGFGDMENSYTPSGWVNQAAAVPEPTSGLLLLLGVAGLALRRRRA